MQHLFTGSESGLGFSKTFVLRCLVDKSSFKSFKHIFWTTSHWCDATSVDRNGSFLIQIMWVLWPMFRTCTDT